MKLANIFKRNIKKNIRSENNLNQNIINIINDKSFSNKNNSKNRKKRVKI